MTCYYDYVIGNIWVSYYYHYVFKLIVNINYPVSFGVGECMYMLKVKNKNKKTIIYL